jgi:hypothetical protein
MAWKTNLVQLLVRLIENHIPQVDNLPNTNLHLFGQLEPGSDKRSLLVFFYNNNNNNNGTN